MENKQWASLVLDPLSSARQKLAAVLPPQPEKILRALQNVERALQYSEIEGSSEHVLELARNALRALNMIDKPRELAPRLSLAISTSITAIVKAVRTIEAELPPAARTGSKHAATRKALPPAEKTEAADCQSDDDTIDLLVCAEDLFYEAHGCRDSEQSVPEQGSATLSSDVPETAAGSR